MNYEDYRIPLIAKKRIILRNQPLSHFTDALKQVKAHYAAQSGERKKINPDRQIRVLVVLQKP